MKRHPFLLLEVLIAIILVGGFAYITIHGAFGMISKQRKLIQGLEIARNEDLIRMDIIKNHWNQLEALLGKKKYIENGYKVTCEEGKTDQFYLLKLEKEEKAYHYFVTKQART